MKSFLPVATVILGLAGGVYGYEYVTGAPGSPYANKTEGENVRVSRVHATRVSKTADPRIRTERTIDTIREMPPRPPHLERMIKAHGGSDFPILIPQNMTRDAATAESYQVRLKILEDGYSAVITTADMDVVIYGTRKVFRRKAAVEQELQEVSRELAAVTKDRTKAPPTTQVEAEAKAPVPRVRPAYQMRFEEADDGRGGSISFGRYGADYHLEFYCRSVAALDGANCIDEAGAHDFIGMMEEAYDGKK